jgi:hypothetical protein
VNMVASWLVRETAKIAKAGAERVAMDAGVGVNEDALGGQSLGTVAGDGVAVIEVLVLCRIPRLSSQGLLFYLGSSAFPVTLNLAVGTEPACRGCVHRARRRIPPKRLRGLPFYSLGSAQVNGEADVSGLARGQVDALESHSSFLFRPASLFALS